MGLPLLLEDGPDAVQRAVELVLVLEAEVQFPVLQRIHHVRDLLDVLPAHVHRSDHRCDDRNEDNEQYDLPNGQSPYFFSFAYSVGRLTPSRFAAAEMLPLQSSIASRTIDSSLRSE